MPQEPTDTVEIENPNNPGHKLVINRTDYDPDQHRLYEEVEAADQGQGDEGVEGSAEGQGYDETKASSENDSNDESEEDAK